GRVPVLVADEPEVRDCEQAECDDAAHERAAVRGRGDRHLPEQDVGARDDERAVDPEGEVARLNEAEVLAPSRLIDRTATLGGERAHDAVLRLRIMATMSSRLREITSGGPETTTSTPSRVRCGAGCVSGSKTNAMTDPDRVTPTKSSATPTTPCRVVTAYRP